MEICCVYLVTGLCNTFHAHNGHLKCTINNLKIINKLVVAVLNNITKKKRLTISDIEPSIIGVFDALAESHNMCRAMAFHCLLLDYFKGFPNGTGLPDTPFYENWTEHTDELQNHYSDTK